MRFLFSAFFTLCLFLFSNNTMAEKEGPVWWNDTMESAKWIFEGSYLQFTQRNSLYYAGAAAPAIWYSFEHDKRIQKRYGKSDIANLVDHVGDAGVVLNFPLLHMGFYLYGKKMGNERHVQFAKEYFSAMYLALFETGILSYIDIHERPNTGDTSFWEERFRGDSSWPSGHVIPYTSLFFKVMQFYGPKWASIPFALSVMASMQRIQDDKHWLSDVVTSFFISAWASEGVRAAAGYDKNHPFYKWAFEHNLRLGFIRKGPTLGPSLTFNF